MAISRHDAVRIVEITGSPEDHLVLWRAERPPRVGDVGTVVDISDQMGGVGRHYTVELRHGDATQVWLAVFSEHELAIVP